MSTRLKFDWEHDENLNSWEVKTPVGVWVIEHNNNFGQNQYLVYSSGDSFVQYQHTSNSFEEAELFVSGEILLVYDELDRFVKELT